MAAAAMLLAKEEKAGMCFNVDASTPYLQMGLLMLIAVNRRPTRS
jgi:hypothetical protein